jgi:hypothetical protein
VITRLRLYRIFGVLAMAMQLVLPPALSIADGLLERDGGTAAASHVEDHSRTSCRPAHTGDCAICRTLSHLSAPRGAPPCVAVVLDAPAIGRETLLGNRPDEAWFGPPPSRAPPA